MFRLDNGPHTWYTRLMAALTYTFESDKLTPSERAWLDNLVRMHASRSLRVSQLVSWLNVSETMANALIAYYVHGRTWKEIALELDKTPEALRARAAQLRNEHGENFWTCINTLKNSKGVKSE